MNWTTAEIRYLEEHAGDGARAIAEALGRTVDSVKWQARQCGLSLRRRWQCPKCGMQTFKPLNRRSGWCSACTKEERAREYSRQVHSIEEEVRREEKANRERQRLYNRKYVAKKKRN